MPQKNKKKKANSKKKSSAKNKLEKLPDIRVGKKIIKPTKEQEKKLRSLVAKYGPDHIETRTYVCKIAGQDSLPKYRESDHPFQSEEFRKRILESKEQPAKEHDPVNRPSHYTDGKIEVIDFIEDKKLDFHLGNAVKYIARAGKKDPSKKVEDLKKAQWYLNRAIMRLEQKANPEFSKMIPLIAGIIGAGMLAHALKKKQMEEKSKK